MIRTRVYHADNSAGGETIAPATNGSIPQTPKAVTPQPRTHSRERDMRRGGQPQRQGGGNRPPGRSGPRPPSQHRGGRRDFKGRPPKPPAHTHASVNTSNPSTLSIPGPGENIRIIPLGGVEEIGRNMTAIEFRGDIIVIDAGIQFSTPDTPGIDFLLPNTTYLRERKHQIKALLITHGHLDHIGAVPYVMDALGNPPIYTREFGALLIKKRQSEFAHLPALNIKIVDKNDGSIPITPNIKVRFFGLTHAIPDSTGIIIETPFGDVVFTGDVRVENENGVVAEEEIEQYKIFKDRKILLLAIDSTGTEKPGWGISEKAVIKNIDAIIKSAPGRIIIATFASQVDRIIHFITIAKKYGRKVVVEGRSMKNNVEIIKHLDLADVKHSISIDDMKNYPPHKLLILATGGQGEEFAALVRIANKTHKEIRLERQDTVILSSSIIPGNDRSVAILKDNLYRHDCRVITYLESDVHTSGHGKRSELEWIHRQIPYRFLMPVHGHHFMLKMHAELARNLGAKPENIVVPDNGSIVEITEKGEKIVVRKEKVPGDPTMVDGFAVGAMQEVVLRDRQMLSEDGMFVIIATVNSQNGKLRKSPDIISRGFVYLRESQDLLRNARFIIKKTVEDTTVGMNPINFDYVKSAVTDKVSEFLFQKTAKRPIVIPVILGV